MRSIHRRYPLLFGLLAALLCSQAFAAEPETDDTPFGPEVACYKSIRNFFGTRDVRFPGSPSSKMSAIFDEMDSGPTVIGLEELSADKKAIVLHLFTASGEMKASVPYTPGKLSGFCITGVSYPGGVGSVVYSFTPNDGPLKGFGSFTSYRQGDGCDEQRVWKQSLVTAHQVGVSGQAASKRLLDGEIGIAIKNVHANWEYETQHASGAFSLAFDSKTGVLSPQANRTALQGCVNSLKDPELRGIKAIASQEITKFDKTSVTAPSSPGSSGDSGGFPSGHVAE